MKVNYFRGVMYSLLWIYCVLVAIRMFAYPDVYQWDFKLYYYASKAYTAGLNPYDSSVLYSIAKEPLNIYNPPSIALTFFRLFSLFNYAHAYYLFLAFKCVILCGLIYLWREKFLEKDADILFYILCLFAFRSALYIDMRAGNINMLVQLMVWLAFLCYLRNRLVAFSMFIILSAMYNLITVYFLVLLLLAEHKKKYQYLFMAAIFLCGVLMLTYMRNPFLFKCFIKNALSSVQDERGLHQPSTLPFITDNMKVLFSRASAEAVTRGAQVLYLIVAAVVVVISWYAAKTVRPFKNSDREKLIIYLSCVVYALIHPRFKDYYYILLIIPTYFIIVKARHVKAYVPLFVLVVLPSILSYENPLPGFGRLGSLLGVFWEYYPLIIAYFVWGLYLYEIFASEQGGIPTASSDGR